MNAIVTRKLCFSYESGLNKKPVLNCVDMKVPQGEIYGLLGPSGCGKTSLLKAIIGLLKPDAGYLSVFGHEPGSGHNDIPGVGVGYMPQEIGLQEYLKVKEIFRYFGNVYFKNNDEINTAMNYFLKLLNLKDQNAIIGTLSGGQKRRVSLAVAVFTEPRLLILDEPTVGVDPLLCNAIWSFLKGIARNKSITIIVTTHYIEEMKFAQKVAFMRDGEILKEDTPNRVLKRYCRNTLEEVFYDVSYKQLHKKRSFFTRNTIKKVSPQFEQHYSMNFTNEQPLKSKQNCVSTYLSITSILIWENFIKYCRHSASLLILLIPMFVLFITSSAIGRIPDENRLAWVVEDDNISNAFSVLNVSSDPEFESDYQTPYLPDLLYAQFNRSIIKLINYKNLTKAIEDVKRTKIIGAVYLSANFSFAFYERDFVLNKDSEWIENSTIEAGSVHMWLDMNNPLCTVIIHEVYQKILTFREEAYEAIGVNKKLSSLPIRVEVDINGIKEMSLSQMSGFTTVGIFVTFIFGLSLSTTSIHFQIGNSVDLLTRSFSAGIRSHHIIIAVTIVNFIILASTAIIDLFFIIFVLNVHCKGYLIYAVINIVLVSLSGVSSGLLFALLLPNMAFCTIFSSGYLVSLLMLSGILWPILALPYFIKSFALFLPVAIPTSAMHSIFDYENMDFNTYVLPSFLVSVAHTVVYSIISCYVLNKKQ